MTRDERKNLKCDPMTYRKLKTVKQDGETWDDLLGRLVDAELVDN